MMILIVFAVLVLYCITKTIRNATDTRKKTSHIKERKSQAPDSATNQSDTLSAAGKAGELAVSSILHSLPPEYCVLDNIIIPDQVTDPNKKYTTQIDHVVVSPYGIFVIETKNYSGRVYGEEKSQQWAQTFKAKEGQFFYNPVKQNWGHIYALSEHLRLNVRLFKPVVVFSNNCRLNVESTVPVIYVSELKNRILSYTEIIIPERKITEIINRLNSLCLVGEEIEDKHVWSIRVRFAEQEMAVPQCRCPRSGAKLNRRKGKYGAFYGCSNYPQCLFTSDLKE